MTQPRNFLDRPGETPDDDEILMENRATDSNDLMLMDASSVRHPPSIVVTRGRAVALIILGYSLLFVVGWQLFMYLESAVKRNTVLDQRAEQSTLALAVILGLLMIHSLYRVLRRPR